MRKKEIACDSSSIIALSANCLLWVLEKFKNTKFVITKAIEDEIFYVPVKNKRYGLEAMRNGLYIDRVFVTEEAPKDLTKKLQKLTNHLYYARGRGYIEILQRGELEALAYAINKGIDTILVDEKNTRLVIEAPEILQDIISKRTGLRVTINEDALYTLRKLFKNLKVIRSAELVAVAIKKGYINWPYQPRELLENTLYALKYSGCAITEREIRAILDYFYPVIRA